MEEVRIQVKKAHTFINVFVKIVTVISLVTALSSFYIWRNKAGAVYQRQIKLCDTVLTQGINEESILRNPIQERIVDTKVACIQNATATYHRWRDLFVSSLILGLFLPMVYLSITSLYRKTAEKLAERDYLG